MLSIIICSVNLKLFNDLADNISRTIGEVKHEIIRIDNQALHLGIAAAYNLGIKRANYSLLLFIHEDILFHTEKWGEVLLSHFNSNSKIGLIGIAGTKVKTNTPTAWWENEPASWVMNLIQHYSTGKTEKIYRGFGQNDLEEVVLVDGVFLAMRKDDAIFFDERLKGFHNYDQSISLKYRRKGYKVFVTNQILIEHFSIGTKDKSWLLSNFEFQKFYKKDLPQTLEANSITRVQKAYSYMRLYNNFKNMGDKIKSTKYFFKYLYYKSRTKKDLRLLKEFLIWSIKD